MVVKRIVNFGRDNADAIDGYVYIAGPLGRAEPDLSAACAGRFHRDPIGLRGVQRHLLVSGLEPLLRQPAARVLGWQRLSDDGALKTVITYIAPLGQFILTYPSADDLGIWKMYRSPNVYGPWTLVASYTNWSATPGKRPERC